jgi:hypothetical protein
LPLELKATVGPTYSFALAGPLDWEATALRGSLEVADDPYGAMMRAPVREGTPRWVRFGSTTADLSEERPWLLSVESEDGLWAGHATVEPGQGIRPDPVALTLAPTARLDVELVSAATLVDPIVGIEALVDGKQENLIERDAGLPAGEYRVLLSTEGFEQHESTLTLVAGEALQHRIEIVQGPSVAYVRGELASASGAYDEQITLWLTSTDGEHEVMQMPRWEPRDGELVAPFAFDNLPPGEYALTIFSFRSHHRWDTPPGRLTPPAEGLVLVCRDTDPTRTLEIRVRDAATAEPIPLASSSLTAAGCATAQIASGGGGRSFFSAVPLDAELSWWAQAEGYAPAFGDHSAVVGEGDQLVIEVGLDPGWGARLQAVDRATGDPLPGVAVTIDAEAAGVTGADGRLDLRRDVAPGRIDVSLAGWRFDSGDYDREAATLTGFGPTKRLLFVSDPR